MGNVFILLLGLISCKKCGPFPEKFKVVGLDFNTFSAVYSETQEPRLTISDINNNTVVYNLYSILINTKIQALANEEYKNNYFDLINTAYACTPNILRTDERIDSILVIPNEDFDATHSFGEDLSELFDIVVYDPANGIDNEKFKLTDYISTKPSPPVEMFLILNSPPAVNQDFEFTVKYYQNGIDFDFFEFKTEKVFIRR